MSANRDDCRYIWIYEHSDDESHDTLVAAITIAGQVAATEAAKDGKTYIVASTNARSVPFMRCPSAIR
jgi:hypothetical protein